MDPSRILPFALFFGFAVLAAADTAAARAHWQDGPFGHGDALVGSGPVERGPSAVAVDAATHTVYVASGNNQNGPNAGGNTVSVIDARRCNAREVSRCAGPWPTIIVGDLPSAIAVDSAAHTMYVTTVGDNSVAVVDVRSCSARVTSGCAQTPAKVPVGSQPTGIFADERNHTVYVANFNGGTVSMIDSATCNGRDASGCPVVAPPSVAVGGSPVDVDANPRTDTVYVANLTGLSAFDKRTCNATRQSGCGTIGQAAVPPCDAERFSWCGPFSAKVDPANNTIFESDGTTTVWVFDGRRCHAGNLAGCATDTPGAVTPFPEPGFEATISVAVDVPLHSVYVTYHKDDALMVIDTDRCNGRHLAACASIEPREIHAGANPESVALDPTTQTLYTADEVDNTVSLIDATRCSARVASRCRPRSPSTSARTPSTSPMSAARSRSWTTARATRAVRTVARARQRSRSPAAPRSRSRSTP